MKKVIGILTTVFAVIMIAAFVAQPKVSVSASQPAAPVLEGDGAEIVYAPEWTMATREWTAAELAAAQPMPVPELSDFDATKISKVPEARGGEAGTVAATLPEGMSAEGFAESFDIVPASPNAGYDYPAPFTRYTDYGKYFKSWPAKAIGVLFFYQRGYAYRCSAASSGYASVWTAGHCIHDGSGSSAGWSYNVIFMPSYDSGKKIGWQWLAYRLGTTYNWYTYGLPSGLGYDYAAANVLRTKRRLLIQKVGALGFAWNWGDLLHWFAIGYPAASPFNGAKQVVCAASWAYNDTSIANWPHGIGCDQTGGTSGGPWVFKYGTYNYINGNQSYRYSNHPNELFSPYYDSSTYSLWYNFAYQVP
jgi:hypothetical protein